MLVKGYGLLKLNGKLQANPPSEQPKNFCGKLLFLFSLFQVQVRYLPIMFILLVTIVIVTVEASRVD